MDQRPRSDEIHPRARPDRIEAEHRHEVVAERRADVLQQRLGNVLHLEVAGGHGFAIVP
jgi:hypothetical protein